MAAKPPAVLLMAGEPTVDVAADIRETRLWGIARRNRLETVEFMMNERNKWWVLLACGGQTSNHIFTIPRNAKLSCLLIKPIFAPIVEINPLQSLKR